MTLTLLLIWTRVPIAPGPFGRDGHFTGSAGSSIERAFNFGRTR
jgi:hypothetical protein